MNERSTIPPYRLVLTVKNGTGSSRRSPWMTKKEAEEQLEKVRDVMETYRRTSMDRRHELNIDLPWISIRPSAISDVFLEAQDSASP